ncbi:hypothetical protein SEA_PHRAPPUCCINO_3 [Mycobacterium phage Phrappuccino]|uniref:Uncharacterized protein n=1 Tax=Mycobacterium phage Phrappuccino TaxID=2591223 RepID=A0A514DDI2_9CAUD|nr:hypothetical protein KHQ87_gp003 [Mycobacterium phage Phrappuccino]QDH91681.1 hypothetical protein SEA_PHRAPPUCCINO_3 [Mycobacterium phage Phrappuccino]QIQ63125.1 hypothetical protein SEA_SETTECANDELA_3 [Mycobacterium phage Settecandela]
MRCCVAGGSKGSKISALIDQCEYFDPPTEDQRRAAARALCGTVSRNVPEAEQAAVAHDLMGMLGLLPGQESEEYLTGPAPMLNRDCS